MYSINNSDKSKSELGKKRKKHHGRQPNILNGNGDFGANIAQYGYLSRENL